MRLRSVAATVAATAVAFAATSAPAVADPPSRIYKDQGRGAYCYEWQHERGGNYGGGGWHDCHVRYEYNGRNCSAWVRWSHDDWNRGYWEGSYSSYRGESC